MVKRALIILFAGILAAMLGVTIRASFDRNVLMAGADLWRDPWGMATLFDAYFGFLTFYLWVLYKEVRSGRRVLWLVLIMTLGNIAMAAYMLRELLRMGPDETLSQLLVRKNA